MLRMLKELLLSKRLRSHSRADSAGIGADTTVLELSKKLWNGFSLHARKDLHQMVNAPGARAQKTLAALELAKFHAFKAQWPQTLYYLDLIQEVDKDIFLVNGAGPLYVEAMLACDRSSEADRFARHKLDRNRFRTDHYCALSNVMATQHKDAGDTHLMRLALLNSLYEENKLARLDLIDSLQGFAFGNLAAAEAHLSRGYLPQKVSVLMTVFNAESVVLIAVASILNQTWHNLELVIVDDASTDNSWELIRDLAGKDRRIIHIRNETTVGVYRARNKALSLATGDFVTVHDSNHWAHPQMLYTQIQGMLYDPGTKLSFRGTASVSQDMKYILRVRQDGAQYVFRGSQSYVIGRSDIQFLDRWDGVIANADEEFVQRARSLWGDASLRSVLLDVPMSFSMKCSSSLGTRGELDVRSPTSGVRREYEKQAEFWRTNVAVRASDASQGIPMERVSMKRPFPVPRKLAPRGWARNQHYNLIIISDLTLLGGTRRCNEGYIAAAMKLHMTVGLFHWARYDLRLADDIAGEYRTLSYSESVDILTEEDRVSADLVVIHHPPIMKYLPDAVPTVETKRLAILVNQLPVRFDDEGSSYYEQRDVEADCSRLFGVCPVWIPISPLVRRVLSASGFAPLSNDNWIPPLGRMLNAGVNARSAASGRRHVPVIGRHSRDHRTKWPENEEDLRAAFCADSEIPVRFLGGAAFARRVLKRWPENWQELAFDSVPVSDFLDDLDFFVHFTHSAYIEEFGRNVMEAMASGIPAIVPPRFKEVFGDAACYSDPKQVEHLIRTMWGAKSAYVEQVDRGLHFVREFASNERVEHQLLEAIHGSI